MDVRSLNGLMEHVKAQLSEGHHIAKDGSIYVDTEFLNATRHIPGVHVNHMGFGEFEMQTPWGVVEVDRMRGKDFPGQSGRSHKLYDRDGGQTAAEKVVAAMEKAGKSTKVESKRRTGSAAVTESGGVYAKANAAAQKAINALMDAGMTMDARRIKQAMPAKDQLSAHKLGKLLKMALKSAEDLEQGDADEACSDALDAVHQAAEFAIKRGLEQPLPPAQARPDDFEAESKERTESKRARSRTALTESKGKPQLSRQEKALIRKLVRK